MKYILPKKNKKKIVSTVRDYGFRAPLEINPEEYTFAGRQVLGVPINPSKDFTVHLPSTELQFNKNFDSNACFIYGTLAVLEILLKFHTGEDYNLSERYTAYYSSWTPYGGNPHATLEALRKFGFVDEAKLPFTEDITRDTYILSRMHRDLVIEGKRALEEWDIKHDWLFAPQDKLTPQEKADLIDKCLGFCPVAVSVRAWEKKGDVYVKEVGDVDTHWLPIYKMMADSKYKTFDTYEPFLKTLSKNYDFNFAKRITLRKKEHHPNWFIDFIGNLFKWLK